MGAVRGRKKADPTETKEPLCQPGSSHRWEERKREQKPNGSDVVTWRCFKCKLVIIVTTKTFGRRKLDKRRTKRYIADTVNDPTFTLE